MGPLCRCLFCIGIFFKFLVSEMSSYTAKNLYSLLAVSCLYVWERKVADNVAVNRWIFSCFLGLQLNNFY